MNFVRIGFLAAVALASVSCFSDDGADGGGGCADCVLSSGDYVYSDWSAPTNECGFDYTDLSGDFTYVDVFGDSVVIDDYDLIDLTLTDGRVEGTFFDSIDLSGNGFDCVIDETIEIDGHVPEDDLLEVDSVTIGLATGSGTECDEALADFGLDPPPCESSESFTLTYDF